MKKKQKSFIHQRVIEIPRRAVEIPHRVAFILFILALRRPL
jgi:hypothetical protein